jgi:hypothetical protein
VTEELKATLARMIAATQPVFDKVMDELDE